VNRIEVLRSFIQANPKDPFPKYGLALELKNSGKLQDAAATFDDLMTTFPDYTPAYLHAGNVRVELGDKQRAREIYRRGIEACTRQGDHHARDEIEAALATIDGDPS